MIISEFLLGLRTPISGHIAPRNGVENSPVKFVELGDSANEYPRIYEAFCNASGALVRIVPNYIIHHDFPESQAERGPYIKEIREADESYYYFASAGWASRDLDEKVNQEPRLGKATQYQDFSYLTPTYFLEYWSRLFDEIRKLEEDRIGSVVCLDPRWQWNFGDADQNSQIGNASLEALVQVLGATIYDN